MDTFEDYFTYTMGLTEQNKADIRRLRIEIAAIKSHRSSLQDLAWCPIDRV
jgi:hypothetical protein